MRRRQMNPGFAGKSDQKTNEVPEGLLRQARRSGQLNLSNRCLRDVPEKVWKINTETPAEAKNVSLDYTDEKWWDQVDLTKLILASNELKNLSSDVICLPALEYLDIHDNGLEGIPDEVGSLENLKKLNLCHNKITSLPSNLGHLTNLCSLKLEHNCLSSVGEWLGNLVHLDELDMSNNSITQLPTDFSRLRCLRNLNLSNNSLVLVPSDIGQLPVLEDLNISMNKISQLPSDMGNLKSLKRLDCRQNQLTSVPSLANCSALKELYLGNNRIATLEGNDFTGLSSLSILDLRDNQITRIPDEITALEELQRIDLSNNSISSLPFTMGTMQHLKAVVLDGNPLRMIRRDVVMKGTQAILTYLKSRITVEEKPEVDQVDSKVPDRPSASLAASPSSGVDLHTLNKTKAFTFSGKKLTEVPEEVVQAAVTSEVTTVDLSKNLLTQIPQGLVELRGSLSDLNVGFNKLATLSDNVSCFVKLQFLDLRNNQLSELPTSMTALVSLREITIAYNRFSCIPSVLYSIPSMRTILAGDNQVRSIDVDGLLRLPVLETLDLQNNDISQVPPELGNVTTLQSLQLGGNSFRNPRATIIANGTSSLLEYLRSRIPT